MSPAAFHFDPTEASKQALRNGLNRASMVGKRASRLGKRASLATRRLTPRPVLHITDVDGQVIPAEPEYRFWNTSVTNIQQVQIFGDEDNVRVHQDTRRWQHYVKNVFREPTTALYPNPEYARSSTCLSALSVEKEFEDFDGAHAVATDSANSFIASVPGDFEVDKASTCGTASQSTSLMSSAASSFLCTTSSAMESTRSTVTPTAPSQRSSLDSLPNIIESAPVLPDFSADFEPFEVHFPAERISITVSFSHPARGAPASESDGALPPSLQPGLAEQLEAVEEDEPPTPEMAPTDYLPVIPLVAPFDPYNEAYNANPAGHYSTRRWTRINTDRTRRRPYTVGDLPAQSSPRTPQFETEEIQSSTNELFLPPHPSPTLPDEQVTKPAAFVPPSPHTRPTTLTLTPQSSHTIPRKPVPTPLPDTLTHPPFPHPTRAPPSRPANLSSRYPRLDTNKPLPAPPVSVYARTRARKQEMHAPRPSYGQSPSPAMDPEVEDLCGGGGERATGGEVSLRCGAARGGARRPSGEQTLRRGLGRLFGRK